MTQEFHISVTPVGNDQYLVRTERVAPGVPLAEEQVTWFLEEWLSQAQSLMNDPLLGFLQGQEKPRVGGFELPFGDSSSSPQSPQSSLTLVELGQQLYSALFQGRLRDSWMTAQGIAQHKGELLRLRLGLKGLVLPRLPWEVLYASDAATEPRQRNGLGPAPRPITAGTDVLFSRYQPNVGMMGAGSLAVEPDQPLRILMAIATPSDQERLELMREAAHLQQELRSPDNSIAEGGLGKLPAIHLTILEQADREHLTQALEQGQYHVLHYAGHSNLGAAGGDLYLVNNRTGLTETLNGNDLAGLLVNNGIRMAVFNSCRGAHTAASDPTVDPDHRNLMEALVNRGIPAVLAMAERIPDNVALTLSRLFYRNLKQGYTVDLSLSRARQGLITSYGSHQLYWALPVLYMHQDFDGYLVLGDRTNETPAERFTGLPPLYPATPSPSNGPSSTPVPSLSALMESDEELAMISKAVLGQNPLQSLRNVRGHNGNNGSEIINDDPLTDDLTYDDDRLTVAELLQQISSQSGTSPAIIPVTDSPLLSSDQDDPELDLFQETHQDPVYQSARLESSDRRPLHQQNTTVYGLDESPRHYGSTADVKANNSPAFWDVFKDRYVLLPLVGVVGAVAIVVVGARWLPNLVANRPTPAELLPSPNPAEVVDDVSPDALGRAETSVVTAIATSSFSRNEPVAGQQAVAELLSRGALQEAQAALAAVPVEQVDTPDIIFLRGRLAWESVKRGNNDFSVDDARRDWEKAVKGKPDAIPYLNALGFALYAEGKSENAFETWCQSLALQTQAASASAISPEATCPVPSASTTNPDALTAAAGIALVLQQGADGGNLGDSETVNAQASQLYRIVMESDPLQFQPSALAKNWLWTEAAIRDWRSLAEDDN